MFNYLDMKVESSSWVAHCIVDENLPCLQGHFPSKPILPAIAQLDMLIGFVSSVKQVECVIEKAPVLKFMQPILPQDRVELTLNVTNHEVQFTIDVDGKLCTRGKFSFGSLV